MSTIRGKSGLGELLLLVPACCAWPLLVARLAAARALASVGSGLVLGIRLAAAMLLVFTLADVPPARAGAVPH